ncbi:MAG TPA: DUF1015 domain-containing protein [Tepidisphaeraceae bacterium]|nr:DUF1015 domain-containing protein [Tepidisphaeraceae bacterium]
MKGGMREGARGGGAQPRGFWGEFLDLSGLGLILWRLMAHIRPFSAIRYASQMGSDLSQLIAPPYDVLNEQGKAALQAKHTHNIVTVDLPHMPPKTVGPDEAYERSHVTLQTWLKSGVLAKDARPALYPYAQTYEHAGRTYRRRGFFGLVKLSPFGAGEVVPHEKTHKEAIEDRLKLMRATRVQLSPIFGLYSDPKNEVASLLYRDLGKPAATGTLDEVRNDLWVVPNAEIENKVIDLLGQRSIYIADGHHRYTTALKYQAEMREANGGTLPEAHPANWCLFVLIGMQDSGLLILPTHRLIGGLTGFNIEGLKTALKDTFEVSDTGLAADRMEEYLRDMLPKAPPHTFGVFDGKTRKIHQLRLKNLDVLKALEPDKSDAWRHLDVAILQRYLLDEVIQPTFAGGKEPIRSYTADPAEITPQVDGQRYQMALMLQSTPLMALEELGKHGEVMPQKSTYFFPKLATGLVINPL